MLHRRSLAKSCLRLERLPEWKTATRGSFVPCTVVGGCSTDKPVQTNLSKLPKRPDESLKRVLFCPFMDQPTRRWLFIMPKDWTWWVWLDTACLIVLGLAGMPEAFLAAFLLSIGQSVLFFARHRTFNAFSVQLRLAYTLLLIVCSFPPIRWLYWLPAVGTFALVIFGYCLMARTLSLLPWNRTEPITADLLRRTFLSRPRLPDRTDSVYSAGCGGGLCSIEAQVGPGRG